MIRLTEVRALRGVRDGGRDWGRDGCSHQLHLDIDRQHPGDEARAPPVRDDLRAGERLGLSGCFGYRALRVPRH